MRNAILGAASALLLAMSFGLGGATSAEDKPKLEQAYILLFRKVA